MSNNAARDRVLPTRAGRQDFRRHGLAPLHGVWSTRRVGSIQATPRFARPKPRPRRKQLNARRIHYSN